MRNILLLIRNGAFAVAIAVALSFGAAEALSGSPGPTTRLPPELTAAPDTLCTFLEPCTEDGDCDAICVPSPPYYGGTCDYEPAVGYKCCLCFE